MITHYDLFAGIGGFSLALEEVFKDEPIRHIFCEWERFPTAVLKRHWPDGEFWGDIAELVADTRNYPDWNRNWQEVAFATCDDSVDDGLPRLVDGVPQSYAKWRQNSLKAYGNGIVPEVAINIMKAVKEEIAYD